MLARIMAGAATAPAPPTAPSDDATSRRLRSIRRRWPSCGTRSRRRTRRPAAPVAAGGVGWRDYGPQQIVELIPPPDLRQRLEVLPQTYLAERKVIEQFKLVTSKARGKALLADALTDESDSSWPEAHYLGPLHPVIDWAADRAMASLGRNQVFAVRGDVDHPTILLLGTLTNRRGQVVASSYLTAEFPNPANPAFCMVTPHESATAMAAAVGYAETASNPGAVAGADALRPLIAHAVRSAAAEMAAVFAAAQDAITAPGRGVVAPGHGLDRRGRRAHPALRAPPAPRQRPGGAGNRGADGARAAAHPAAAHRGATRPPGRRVRGGIGHGRERRPDRRRGLDQRALLHHRREVRVVPGEGRRAAQGLGRGRQERRRDRPLAVHRRPRPPGDVDRRPARRPAGHRRRQPARAVRRAAPGARLRQRRVRPEARRGPVIGVSTPDLREGPPLVHRRGAGRRDRRGPHRQGRQDAAVAVRGRREDDDHVRRAAAVRAVRRRRRTRVRPGARRTLAARRRAGPLGRGPLPGGRPAAGLRAQRRPRAAARSTAP